MDKKDCIVVLGSGGMVGGALLHRLQSQGYTNVVGVDRSVCDLSDPDQTLSLLLQLQPDFIVITAALVGGIGDNIARPAQFGLQNGLLAASTLQAAHRCEPKRVLFFSSSCVYPTGKDQGIKEEELFSGSPEPTNEMYAIAKIYGMRLAASYRKEFGVSFHSLIPCNLYGPGDQYDPKKSHVVAGLLQRFDQAKKEGRESVVVWGDGTPRREILFVEDAVDATLFLLQQERLDFDHINIGTGVDHTIKEIALQVAETVGYQGKIVFDQTKPNGIARKLLDCTKMHNLGWRAKTGIKKGLSLTYQLMQEEVQKKSLKKVVYPLASSSWDQAEVNAGTAVLRSGFCTMGEKVKAFERAFAEYHSTPFAVCCNSGSSANLLGVAALVQTGRLKAGDQVIVPAVGWSTTYFPFVQYGLELVFVDVDQESFTIDPELVRNAITEKTRCVCAVNLLGVPADFTLLQKICKEHNLLLFEDNCESMGALFTGQKAGTFGEIGTFSSYFSHHICTIEGGMCVTEDQQLYHAMLSIRSHGWDRPLPGGDPTGFCFVMPGYNLRPTELTGAIGIEQLKKLDFLIAARRENAEKLQRAVAGIEEIVLQKERGVSSWFGFAMVAKSVAQKEGIVRLCREKNIETRPIVTGNFLRQPVCKNISCICPKKTPVADQIHDCGFFIGNSHSPLDEEIELLKSCFYANHKVF